MAQDFSNNVAVIAQYQLETVFSAELYDTIFVNAPNALVGLLAKQQSNVEAIKANNSEKSCVGYQAHFAFLDSVTLPTLSSTAVTATCLIGNGDAMTGNKVTYNKDIFSVNEWQYDGGLCSTVFELAMVVAKAQISVLHKAAMALNAEVIDRVNTNIQVATYPSDIGTISGGVVYISDLDLWKPKNAGSDLMPYFDDIAAHEGLPSDYIILAGSALSVAIKTANFIQVNDNEAAEQAVFSAYGDRIVIDREGMQAAGFGDNVFLIDPRVYGFMMHSEYDASVQAVNDQNNTMKWSVPFSYVSGGKMGAGKQVNQLMYNSAAGMVPARIDLRQQITCNAGGAGNGRPSEISKLQEMLQAAFLFAPANGSGRTNIVKIEKGTP
jgi:hypothetical protein